MRFSTSDWIVLVLTLLLILSYGVYKSKTSKNMDGYFLGDRQMPWYMVMLSIMGTQASAITFLTAPGQAYTDGMRFVQYYFGLPLAMVILCISFVPIFHRLKVFTAYEFLENRFDLKTRTLTSFLFLLSRGMSTGISIYAPSLILHSMLGWDIYVTNLFMGGLLIIYTVTGGAKAVAHTQQFQFIIIYAAMFMAGYWAVKMLPEGISFTDALHISGKAGKLNVITTGFKEDGSFDWKDRYNILSGLIGGLFFALSYFGTDQSQVGRYLTAKSEKESRIGLLMNGLVKVPLQFLILMIGALLFTFYQFYQAPAFFNLKQEKIVQSSEYSNEYAAANATYKQLQEGKQQVAIDMSAALKVDDESTMDNLQVQLMDHERESRVVRDSIQRIVKKANPGSDPNDTNVIFLRFVGDHLPNGLVGLIIAVIFLASWGSIAASLNSLASCTMVDFHKKFSNKQLTPLQDYRWSKIYTLIWGLFCILVSMFAYNLGNSLIEAVNILGSWFYGTILGIFLVAFFFKSIRGHAVFWSAVISEAIVIAVYRMDVISFLWLTVIGAISVIIIGFLLQAVLPKKAAA